MSTHFCWVQGEMWYINYAKIKFFSIAGVYFGWVSKLSQIYRGRGGVCVFFFTSCFNIQGLDTGLPSNKRPVRINLSMQLLKPLSSYT